MDAPGSEPQQPSHSFLITDHGQEAKTWTWVNTMHALMLLLSVQLYSWPGDIPQRRQSETISRELHGLLKIVGDVITVVNCRCMEPQCSVEAPPAKKPKRRDRTMTKQEDPVDAPTAATSDNGVYIIAFIGNSTILCISVA